MSSFIITAEKRIKELEKIESFLSHIVGDLNTIFRNVVGDIRQYISFEHFTHINSITSSVYFDLYPIGYRFGDTGIIYFPHSRNGPDQDPVNRSIKIIAALNDAGVENWILDFRGNGGGNFSAFISYICAFMPDEYIIENVSRTGRVVIETVSSSILSEKYDDNYHITDMPYAPKIAPKTIRVLVDQRSASSAEHCAYLLKIHIGAEIIGKKTMGAFNTPSYRDIMLGNLCYPGYVITGADITPDADYEVLLE